VSPTEGSIVDRAFYSILSIIGIVILARRQYKIGEILKENKWLCVLFVYMVISISWSNYPFVSLKRVIKSIGAAILALVVLSEVDPKEAIATVIRRCAYFHIPLSIITIKYFRHIGVQWGWYGTSKWWTGIATSKNTLGQVAMTSALIFIWERSRHSGDKRNRIIDYVYIAMSIYLLKGSDNAVSMTSVSVFIISCLVFFVLNWMKQDLRKVKRLMLVSGISILTLTLVVVLHAIQPFSENSLMGHIITSMGRDMTLSGRTYIWKDVLKIASLSPILGTGYGAFWIGRLANIPWNANMTWVLGEAHNGYIDTYLQLGWIGIFILMGVIVSSIPKILQTFPRDFEYARLRMTFFLAILFVNVTESTFLRGDHNMWFLFLLVILSVPRLEEDLLLKSLESKGVH